jgi:flagellar biosynthesis anti-sigma factor FlgM
MKIQIPGSSSIKKAQGIGAYQNIGKNVKRENLKGDSIQISSEGKEIARLLKNAAKLPAERTELVTQLKREIKEGHYHISAEKLADKLMDTIKNNK